MKLNDITGVGKSTAEKLEEHGFKTVKDLQGVTIDQLVDLGIHTNTAEKIVKSVQDLAPVIENIEYHVENASEFELFAFKQSEDYDENNLEESYDSWYKKVLIADSKLKSE